MNWNMVYELFWGGASVVFMLVAVYGFANYVAWSRHYDDVQRDYWRNKFLEMHAKKSEPYTGDTQELDITDLYTAETEDDMLDP